MPDTTAPLDSSTDREPLADLPGGVAPVLPFLYVAWADGMLTPAEIGVVRDRIAAMDWLSERDRAQIAAWLDPSAPPDASTYFGWVRTMRQAARRLPSAEGADLAGLGEALAGLAGQGDGAGIPAEARRALEELEAEIGVVGEEVVRDLLEAPAPPEEERRAARPAFSVGALQSLLDAPHAETRDRIRDLLSDPFFAYPEPGISNDAYRTLILQWVQRLGEEGIGSLAYPEWAGGTGDISRFIAAFETLATHDLSLVVKFGVQFGLWGGSVQQLGNEEQRRELLPAIGRGELLGAFAMSERGHGSNVRDLQTTATFDREADEWVIDTPTDHDHKEWIGNAARDGRMATVFAQLVIDGEGHGVHGFLVPLRDEGGAVMPGIRIEDSGHKMGLNGVDNGRVWFSDVRVPRTALLGRYASVSPEGVYSSPIPSAGKRFFVMLGTLVGGRIAVGAAANSAAKAGLTVAVRYGARRRQFGPAGGPEVVVLDYLSHQRRLLPLVATSYGLNFALHALAEDFAALDADADTREVEGRAAALKSMASWHATRALQEAREACGGEGFRWSARIAHRKADSDIFTTFEGDNTVLQLQVAKGLLGGYRQEFEDLNAWGMLRYLREQADVRLGEVNPLARRNTDEAHLLDPAWHRTLFERRERTLLVQVAARLKGRIDRGDDSFDAFVEVQDHLLTLARANAERLVLEAFQDAVERVEDAQLQNTLRLTCALYALEHVERDRGWFLEQNLFDGPVSKAIRTQVNALLGRLRPVAVELVDAFGIPDELLGSEIGAGRMPLDP
ncbi:acyl-CoA dehydrogenase [Rubrivirga sp. S365]|uniref:Acyl-CoA dehydrogenase n=1 Tax=Rubrivirga litoralis TaxID=3075598 RepID=A0ABU3BS67_9BACT|nr:MULTISPECIES: acyl-CoA dehydrogenase [unclassified Rubrivirga]MDT0632144.1 acyl-CoA dehydrogenase [Rubrivirga sp. F394]MDT7857036.1 acyl-CoA dehydrogenase [Rubrivirga sp. S365]